MTERLVTEYTADTSGFRRGARIYDKTLARQQRLTNDRLNRIDRRWERSSRAIMRTQVAVGALSAGLGVTAVVRYAESWRNVERRLQSIGVTSQSAKKDLVELAMRTRSAIGATAEAVQRMAKSTDGDFERAGRRVETLQKLLAAGGASGTERASVSLQLGQALKSGRLSGDEFRSVSENAPVEFLEALAQAAGVTRKELKGFAQEQKLTTDIVLQALDRLAGVADRNFKSIALSGEEAFSVLETGLTAYIGNIDKILGATASINDVMQSLGQYLAENSEGAQTFAKALQIGATAALALAGGKGVGAVIAGLRGLAAARAADVLAADAQSRKSQLSLAAAQSEVRLRRTNILAMTSEGASKAKLTRQRQLLAKAVQGEAAASRVAMVASNAHLAALQRMTLASRVTTATITGLKNVLAFFGGPLGLAMAGIALGATYMASMSTRAEDLTESLQSLEGTLTRTSELNTTLEGDYRDLEDANQRLAAAIKAGGDAAVVAATMDVGAINKRIAGNEHLRAELARVAEAELAEARGKYAKLTAMQREYARDALEDRLSRTDTTSADLPITERMIDSFIEKQFELSLAVKKSGEDLKGHLLDVFNHGKASAEAAIELQALEDRMAALTAKGPALSGALDSGAAAAANLGTQASTAASGVAKLISLIPALDRAARASADLQSATAARDSAISSIGVDPRQGASEAADAAREVAKINELYRQAVRSITGVSEAEEQRAAAAERANEAAAEYASDAAISQLDARGQALAREEQRYQRIVQQLKEVNAEQAALDQAEQAYDLRRQQINSDFDARGGGASAGGVGKATKEAERDLAEARGLLFENGQKALFIEQKLNEERQRLRALLPELISLGLSRAQAEGVIANELSRTTRELQRQMTTEEQRHYNFARNVLSDIKSADNLGDAVSRISDRLWELALDPVFEHLARSFASLGGDGGGGGILGSILGFLFNASGNAFGPGGVQPFAKGGVVDRPTMFSYGGGKPGVMGEAGPEAILPLSRGSDGKLGVHAVTPTVPQGGASGGGGRMDVRFGDIIIQPQSGDPQEIGQEVTTQFFGMFEGLFRQHMAREMRNGGALAQTFQKKNGY